MRKMTGLYIFLLLIVCCLYVCTAEKFIHPDFSITETMMKQKIEELSHPLIKEKILAQPGEFLESMRVLFALPGELFLLVDKNHPLPAAYVPGDLVPLKDYPVKITYTSMMVRQVIMNDLLAMISAAKEEGFELTIASAFRSYDTQKNLFNYWAKTVGIEQAKRESARPGYSQHQLGTTVDFHPIDTAFKDTKAGKWLLSYAREYGFSLSYPDGYEEVTGYIYEPWHYRYIGKEATHVIDNYFLGVQQFFLEFCHHHTGFFREHLKKDTGS
ncbi:MAG: M15 family metallopeptidase [Spirochaetales bacterium]|nr:M15 family metallopeptidase [Spirochaetales bacterium]